MGLYVQVVVQWPQVCSDWDAVGGRASLVCGNKLWRKSSHSETLYSLIVAISKATQASHRVLVTFSPIRDKEFISNYY